MKNLLVFLLLLFIVLIVGFMVFDWGKASSTANNTTTHNTTNNVHKDTVTKAEEIDQYVETGLKVADKAIETIDKKVEQNQEKKKARAAARKSMWVYQVGAPFEDKDAAAMAYHQLKHIPGVMIFKKEWNEMYLVVDEGAPSKEQLENSAKPFRNQLSAANVTSRVTIVDITQVCPSNEQPVVTESITYKVDGQRLKAPCMKCN